MSYNSTINEPVKYYLDQNRAKVFYRKTLSPCMQTVPVAFDRPLNPPGQEVETVLLTRFLTASDPGLHPAVERGRLFQPKQSDCRAFIAGDKCEIESFFDELMRPAPFLYGYATGTPSASASNLSRDALAFWADDFKKQHPEMYDEPDDDSDEDAPLPANPTPEQQAEYRKRSQKRAKNTARRIIRANRHEMMWTFSFSPEPKDEQERAEKEAFGVWRFVPLAQQKDRKVIHKAWNVFMTGFRRYCKQHQSDVTWLKVLEPHDSEETSDDKRGTYHIHISTNLRIDKMTLQRLWGFGTVWFSDYTKHEVTTADGKRVNIDLGGARDPSSYLCKYIEKDFDEAATCKERAFTCSQNCKRPQKVYQETVNEIRTNPVKGFDLDGMNPTIKRKLIALKSLDAIKIDVQDIGYGAGVYPTCYTRKDANGETIEVRGFKKIEVYDALLLLPAHRKRYEAWKQKRAERAQKRVDQLAFFDRENGLIEKK